MAFDKGTLPAQRSEHTNDPVAKRDHRINGKYRFTGSAMAVDIDLNIIKGKTRLSEIPEQFRATVKAEQLF